MTRVHGGPDAQGAAPHDFSTNANACGPCPPALAAVQAADRTRYPDPAYAALRQALGRRHGVDPARIVPAASASEFITRCTAWAARSGLQRALVPAQAYGDYAAAARAWGLALGAGEGPALAWACEPSSPLGQADARLAALARDDGVLLVDRAYEPLRLDGAPTPDPARAWTLWTPNKALGLTGVRAAYAVAPDGAQEHVRALDALAPSWVLGAEGVALLQAWCEPAVHDWLQASLAILRRWKQAQSALCEGLGWTVLPSHANYFVARAPFDARRLAAVRAQGVQLRDCTSFGLPWHLRLSVQPPAAQQALRAAWEASGG